MTMARIYNMAMHELLRIRECDAERLERNPSSEIAANRIKKHDEDINQLHDMIIKEEQN